MVPRFLISIEGNISVLPLVMRVVRRSCYEKLYFESYSLSLFLVIQVRISLTCIIAQSNPRRLLPIWREKLRSHYHVTMTSDNDFCV